MKYRNKKIEEDGLKFDSKLEWTRYRQLKLLVRAGLIKDLQTQIKFELQEGFKKNGVSYRPITYIADFVYTEIKTEKKIIEDTKGMKTEVYKIKKKLFEKRYPEYTIKEVSRREI